MKYVVFPDPGQYVLGQNMLWDEPQPFSFSMSVATESQCVWWTDGAATTTNGDRPPNGTFSTDSLLSHG